LHSFRPRQQARAGGATSSSSKPCEIELAVEPAPHLRIVEADPAADAKAEADLGAQIVELLATGATLSRDALRAATRCRNATLGEVLARLRAENLIERSDDGFRLTTRPPVPIPVPAASTRNGNGNGNGATLASGGASVRATRQRPSA
jgi:hypothetical protein